MAGPAPTVSVDLARHQITALVPHSEWNPGSSTVRLAAGVGLWNAATNSYLLPRGGNYVVHVGCGGTARSWD